MRPRGSVMKPLTENDYKAFEELETTDKSMGQVAEEFGMTRNTFVYRYSKFKKQREAEKQKKEGDKNGG